MNQSSHGFVQSSLQRCGSQFIVLDLAEVWKASSRNWHNVPRISAIFIEFLILGHWIPTKLIEIQCLIWSTLGWLVTSTLLAVETWWIPLSSWVGLGVWQSITPRALVSSASSCFPYQDDSEWKCSCHPNLGFLDTPSSVQTMTYPAVHTKVVTTQGFAWKHGNNMLIILPKSNGLPEVSKENGRFVMLCLCNCTLQFYMFLPGQPRWQTAQQLSGRSGRGPVQHTLWLCDISDGTAVPSGN